MERKFLKEKITYTILYLFGSIYKFSCVSGCSYTNLMGVLHGRRNGSPIFWEKVRKACNIDEKDMPEMMSDDKFEEDLTLEEKKKLAKLLFKCDMTPGAIKIMLDMPTEELDKVFKVSR